MENESKQFQVGNSFYILMERAQGIVIKREYSNEPLGNWLLLLKLLKTNSVIVA